MSNVSTPMPQYLSHKKVWALQIESVEEKGTSSTTDESPIVLVHFVDRVFAPQTFNLRGKPTPAAGWYFITYEDGYTSFSPAAQFEAGTTLITGKELHGMGWAIKQMDAGSLVARKGWNGKGMFLFLVPGSTFKVNRHPLLGIFAEGTSINYRPHVDMRTADGEIVPWICNQSDLLALDWEIIRN